MDVQSRVYWFNKSFFIKINTVVSNKSGANWKDTTRYFWKVKNIRGVRGKIAILTIVDLLLQNCFPCCLICWPTIFCDIFKLSFIAHKTSLSFLPFPNNSAVFNAKKAGQENACVIFVKMDGEYMNLPAKTWKLTRFVASDDKMFFKCYKKKCIIKCQSEDEPCVGEGVYAAVRDLRQ